MSRRKSGKGNGNSKSPKTDNKNEKKIETKENSSVYCEDAYSPDGDFDEKEEILEKTSVKTDTASDNEEKSEIKKKGTNYRQVKTEKSDHAVSKEETENLNDIQKAQTDEQADEVDEAGIEKISAPARKKAVRKAAAEKSSSKGNAAKKSHQKSKSDKKEAEDTESITHALIRKMVFSLSLGIFCYALTGLLVLMWGYYSSQKEYEKLNEGLVVIGSTEDPDNNYQPAGDNNTTIVIPGDSDNIPFIDIKIDEEKWKAINDDYSFYMYIPGTKIQYPVVQGDDNNHYLRYTYENKENTAGAVAIDYRTDREAYFETFNMIISAHNRQDGTMFSDLAKYKDENFRNKNPYIYIVYDGKEYVFEIFAFYAMKPVAVCYNPVASSDVYLDFINENNTYSMENDVTTDDNIITLYTCNEDSSMRYLCHAVLRKTFDIK